MSQYSPEESSGLVSPLARVPDSGAENNPFLEYHDEKPYHDDPSQESLITPSKQSPNPLLRSSSSPRSAKSGIIFGSPRKAVSPALPNPFSDLQSSYAPLREQNDIPRQLAIPARALKFAKYDALREHGKPEEESYYASPDHEPHYEDNRSEPGSPDPDDYLDLDEDEKIMSYAEKTNPSASFSKRRSFSRFCKWPYYLLGLVLVLACALGAFAIYFTVSFRPHVYYKGTLTSSSGSVSSTGIEFSRHLTLGFTNPNSYNLLLTEVEVWPLYNGSKYFGYTKKDKFKISIPKHATQNATLPIEQSFSYISKKDPDAEMLISLYTACTTSRRVPFEMVVHAKVKLMGFLTVPVSLKRITGADMDCGDNLASMIQSMFSMKSSSG